GVGERGGAGAGREVVQGCLAAPKGAGRADRLKAAGPRQDRAARLGPSMSSNPFSCNARSRRWRTASQGRRISAPIIGGPGGRAADSVKRLDELARAIYRQITLLPEERRIQ